MKQNSIVLIEFSFVLMENWNMDKAAKTKVQLLQKYPQGFKYPTPGKVIYEEMLENK